MMVVVNRVLSTLVMNMAVQLRFSHTLSLQSAVLAVSLI